MDQALPPELRARCAPALLAFAQAAGPPRGSFELCTMPGLGEVYGAGAAVVRPSSVGQQQQQQQQQQQGQEPAAVGARGTARAPSLQPQQQQLAHAARPAAVPHVAPPRGTAARAAQAVRET